jgi:hypothetical protein
LTVLAFRLKRGGKPHSKKACNINENYIEAIETLKAFGGLTAMAIL